MRTRIGYSGFWTRFCLRRTRMHASDGLLEERCVRELLSPKQVAKAIGVSESSLKRWCDRGIIPTARTAGGHRRLPRNGVVRFIRDGGYQVADPGVLGLPLSAGKTRLAVDLAKDRFREAVIEGNETTCRQLIFDVYLAGHPISVICDQVIASAFHEIGDHWECGDLEVFQERRACEIAGRMIHELRQTVPLPDGDSPLAFGSTLDGDPYMLAVGMAELVLRDLGWNASSLGHMLPFDTIRVAVESLQPKLVWLSVSAIRDQERFVAEFNDLFLAVDAVGGSLVVGGRSLPSKLRRQLRFNTFCDSFQNLEDFSRSLLSPSQRPSQSPGKGAAS